MLPFSSLSGQMATASVLCVYCFRKVKLYVISPRERKRVESLCEASIFMYREKVDRASMSKR